MTVIYKELRTTSNELDACEKNLLALRDFLAKSTPLVDVKLPRESDASIVDVAWSDATTGDGDDTLYADGGVAQILESIEKAIPHTPSLSLKIDLEHILSAFEKLGFGVAKTDTEATVQGNAISAPTA